MDLLATLKQQEEILRFANFDSDLAWKIGTKLISDAAASHKTIYVDIQISNRTIFHYEGQATTCDNHRWATMKARVTQLYGMPSYYVKQMFKASKLSLTDVGLNTSEYSASGGCFPIKLMSGTMIGHISVSGYDDQDDHKAIVKALQAILSHQKG